MTAMAVTGFYHKDCSFNCMSAHHLHTIPVRSRQISVIIMIQWGGQSLLGCFGMVLGGVVRRRGWDGMRIFANAI